MADKPEHRPIHVGAALGGDGNFPSSDGSRLREMVANLKAAGAWPDHPSDLLGPWDSLPERAQGAIRREVEEEIRRVMTWHPRGSAWPALVRGLWSMGMEVRQRGGSASLARWPEKWAIRSWQAPSRFRERAWIASHGRHFRRAGEVSLADLLGALGRRPRWLSGDYARGVRVDPRARGFYYDPQRHVAWASLVGIDLILAPDQVWCVEGNVNTGVYSDEAQEIWSAENAVERVLSFARENGFTTLCWHEMDLSPVGSWLMRTLEDKAGSMGLDLLVREDFKVPSRKNVHHRTVRLEKWVTSTLEVPDKTLVVRRNNFQVGTDWVLNDKEPFTRGLSAALAEMGGMRVQVPPMTREPPDVPMPSDPGLPNLVYKYPDSGKGKGVFFMRVGEPSQARDLARELDGNMDEPGGLFQPFVCSRILPGRRIYDIRVEILLSPVGMTPVMVLKREATRSMPTTLDAGLVREPGVFHSNMSLGGVILEPESCDLDRAVPAAQEVGEALQRLLSRGFQVRPPEDS